MLIPLTLPRKLSIAPPALLALLAAAACSTSREATLSLSVGAETDAFTRDPAPTTLVVDSIEVSSGATSNLARVNLPATNVDLGDRDPSSLVRIRASAVDATGRTLVAGTSVQVQLGALEGTSLPIFVQRTSEFARMPAPLADGREAPLLANVTGRYVFVAGGSPLAATDFQRSGTSPANNMASQIYDLGSLSPFGNPPAMPRAPKSVAVWNSAVLLIDDAGAQSIDLSNAGLAPVAVTPPAGGTFGEIAGGITVRAPDASLYVVGATRTSSPSSRVLKITKDGATSFAVLATPRRGAAAAWVEGRGLVIAGGSDTGAGVEVLAPGAATTTALPFPTDATVGAGAAALDATHILLGGGLDAAGQPAATRLFDLACATTACAATVWDGAKVPVALVTVQGFDLSADSALFVGDDATGLSHAVRVSRAREQGQSDSANEIAFKIPRRGARGIRVNPPAITFVGGDATVESFTP